MEEDDAGAAGRLIEGRDRGDVSARRFSSPEPD